MNGGSISKQAIEEVYNFTRCQRLDGSTYGTGGRCRKGREIAAENPDLLSNAKRLAKSLVRKVSGAERREKEALRKKAEDEARAARQAEAIRRKANTADMVNRVKRDAPEGVTVKDAGGGAIILSKTTKSGHKVDYILSRNGNVEFSVNDSWNSGSVKSRREQIEVALSVRRMHEAVVKNLRPGHTVWLNAWVEDGRGGERVNAYKGLGFSDPKGYDNLMVARRTEGGNLKPEPGEIGSSSLLKDQDFSEKEAEDVKLWVTAIFGIKI